MARVSIIPIDILDVLVKKVIIPSGILCIIIAIILNIPTLYSFLFFTLLFSGIILSIKYDNINPIIIPNIKMANELFFMLFFNIKFKLSGIKSNSDTLIMTPEAKAREYLVSLSILHLININMVPIIVDRPAIKVNVKGNIISFILNSMKKT